MNNCRQELEPASQGERQEEKLNFENLNGSATLETKASKTFWSVWWKQSSTWFLPFQCHSWACGLPSSRWCTRAAPPRCSPPCTWAWSWSQRHKIFAPQPLDGARQQSLSLALKMDYSMKLKIFKNIFRRRKLTNNIEITVLYQRRIGVDLTKICFYFLLLSSLSSHLTLIQTHVWLFCELNLKFPVVWFLKDDLEPGVAAVGCSSIRQQMRILFLPNPLQPGHLHSTNYK